MSEDKESRKYGFGAVLTEEHKAKQKERAELEHCEAVAREWCHFAPGNRVSVAELLMRERAAAREQALSEAADACDRARPAGGRAWSEEQAACYEALSHTADYIRSLVKAVPR